MSKLSKLKREPTDREKVGAWLDHIGETDKECRDEVLTQCKNSAEAREYFVRRYEEDCGVTA